jgi:hypothetical protein
MRPVRGVFWKYAELGLFIVIGTLAAFGMEALGYLHGNAAGAYMLAPAMVVISLTLALTLGNAINRSLFLFAVLATIAAMYLFDIANLGFLEWFRANHGEGGDPGAFEHIYWRLISPVSALFASLVTAIVMVMRSPF